MYPVVWRTRKIKHHNPFAEPDKYLALAETYKCLDQVFPKTALIEYLVRESSQAKKEKNQWTIVYILVLGAEGTGKSETIDFLADYFRSLYPEEQSWTAITSTELEDLYDKIPRNKRYVFIASEDATGALTKQYKDIKVNIKKRRWICKQKTGFDEGILIQVLGVHRYFAIPELFRDDIDLLIAKSIPSETNVFDYRHQRKFITPEGVEFLKECDMKRNFCKTRNKIHLTDEAYKSYGHYFGFGVYRIESQAKIGLWYNPIVDKKDLYALEWKRRGEEEQRLFSLTFGKI